jgi:hypothetical protein
VCSPRGNIGRLEGMLARTSGVVTRDSQSRTVGASLLASGWMERLDAFACSRFSRRFARPHGARVTLNITSIEKEGRGRRMPSQRREEEEETLRRDRRKRGMRCNTRSTFEISTCSNCNIRLKADKTLAKTHKNI